MERPKSLFEEDWTKQQRDMRDLDMSNSARIKRLEFKFEVLYELVKKIAEVKAVAKPVVVDSNVVAPMVADPPLLSDKRKAKAAKEKAQRHGDTPHPAA